jgi:hypothetical protein
MMHPHTELRFISEAIGHGVVATRDIPAGTITWIYDELDREFTPEQIQSLHPLYAETMDKYCFRSSSGNWIFCWDHAKFVNHSFRSNCMTTAYDFEIAIRDIRAGEELTDDYGYLNVMQPFRAQDEGTDRTVVYPDDLVRHHEVWDAQLRMNWPRIIRVEQDLRPLMQPDRWELIRQIAMGYSEMESILTCYYDDADLASSCKRA